MNSETCVNRLGVLAFIFLFVSGLHAQQDSCTSFTIFDQGNDGINVQYTHSTSFMVRMVIKFSKKIELIIPMMASLITSIPIPIFTMGTTM